MNDESYKQLSYLLESNKNEEITMSEALENLSQISLVLLIIFIMITVLFNNKLMITIKEAEKWRNDPNTKFVEEKDKAEMELQKQKILNAIEKVEVEYRIRLGLANFMEQKASNSAARFRMEKVFYKGSEVSKDFIEASGYAKEKLPYPEKMRQEWLTQVLGLTGMQFLENEIPGDPNVITSANKNVLIREIANRCKAAIADSQNLQKATVTKLVIFFAEHPQAIDDDTLNNLAEKYHAASTPTDKDALLKLLEKNLWDYAKYKIQKQGAVLLNEI